MLYDLHRGESAHSHSSCGCSRRDRRSGLLDCGVDQSLEVAKVYTAANRVAVDEEERRAVDPQTIALLPVSAHLGLEPMAVQVFGESSLSCLALAPRRRSRCGNAPPDFMIRI